MILETLDVKKNDIFIYSENKFDLANNFKLISKDAKVKEVLKIHFNDVCRFVGDNTPKNLVLYRLLTNIPDFDIDMLKYCYVVSVNGQDEIFHFDPIFAIKELEQYGNIQNYPFLRFRIQQVGLITQMRSFGKVNYSEVYSFDLEASEARWQNDKVFAEMIFAFDNIDFSNEKLEAKSKKIIPVHGKPVRKSADQLKKITATKGNLVEEVVDIESEKVKKLTITPLKKPLQHLPQRFQRIQSKEESVERESTPAAPESKSKPKLNSPSPQPQAQKRLADVFKSQKSMSDFLAERGKKNVVLKLRSG